MNFEEEEDILEDVHHMFLVDKDSESNKNI